MSLASMADNYALRTSAKRSAETSSSFGAQPTPAAPANQLPNVAQGFSNELMRWIPTETLSLYAALAAIVGTDLSWLGSLTLLAFCGVVDVAIVWSLAVRKKVADEGRHVVVWWPEYPRAVPVVEIVLSLTAYAVWVCAVPNSWASHIGFWKHEYGAIGVAIAAFGIPFVAVNSGVSAPSSQISP